MGMGALRLRDGQFMGPLLRQVVHGLALYLPVRRTRPRRTEMLRSTAIMRLRLLDRMVARLHHGPLLPTMLRVEGVVVIILPAVAGAAELTRAAAVQPEAEAAIRRVAVVAADTGDLRSVILDIIVLRDCGADPGGSLRKLPA
jgi:hypothetical protein